MIEERRLLVLGLGGLGSAAAYWAARRMGGEVVGIEQFPLGHLRGGSEDHSRIIRLSYHTPGYVEMAKAAYRAWEQLEVDSGEQVVLRTGGLDLAPAGAAIGLDDYRASMAAVGVAFEELEAAEIRRRWPQWQLADDVTALYQPQAGIAMATRANTAHRRMAASYGATLVDHAPVTHIRETDSGVEVEAGGRRYLAGRVVVAAGAWTNRLTTLLGLEYTLDVTLEQVVYLHASRLEDFHPARFPVWIWMDEPCFYGFGVFGEPAVKVAWDRCEVVTDPDTRSFEPRPEVTRAVQGFVARHLPGVDGDLRLAKTCLYTLTPDRDFILGRLPGYERVVVAVGAGHAFKFASLIGRTLVDLAVDGETDLDLTPFDPARPILRQENPARTYMV